MTWYRNHGFSQLLMAVAAVFAAGSLLYAIVRDDASGISRWTPAMVIIAISVFVYFRLARAGVYAGDEGIRVVNPFRTVRVPWHRVVRFNVRAHKGFPALGFAMLDDGTEVQLWGIQARSPSEPSKRVARELAEALNERLAEARQRAAAA